jgi:predicted amidohydrolase YtcJ
VSFLASLFFMLGCGGAEVDFARSLAVPQPADLILRNGKIVTVDRSFSIRQAVAIKDGRVLAVGGERDMRLLTGPRTRVVDLAGHTVIPGLIDAQVQATKAGIRWDGASFKVAKPTLDQGRQGLRNCFVELNRLGITSVLDVHGAEITFAHRRILAEMARTGELTLRVNYYVNSDYAADELAQLNLAAAEVKQLPQSDWFRFIGFAVEVDAGRPGRPSFTGPAQPLGAAQRERLRRLADFFAGGGYSFRLHGRQSAELLEIIEQSLAATPQVRQRIALAGLDDVSAETVERIRNLGAGIISVGGTENFPNSLPLRKLVDGAIPLGAGSDGFDSGNYSPWLSLWSLVTGKSLGGTVIRDPSQIVSRLEALRMHTLGSAWLSADTHRKGSIEVDKWADLVVLSADYLTVPEEQMRSIESLLTMVGGRVVYAAGRFAVAASK